MKSMILIFALTFLGSTSWAKDKPATESSNPNFKESQNDKNSAVKTSTESTENVENSGSGEQDSEPSSETVQFGDVTGTQKYKFICTSAKDVREITVITQKDDSVGVVYKKFDTVKTVALAKTDPSYADTVAEKIKTNLETAGFTCSKE